MLLGGFGVRDDNSEAIFNFSNSIKLKMADLIWRSHTQNSIIFLFFHYDSAKNYYSAIFEVPENGCKFRL